MVIRAKILSVQSVGSKGAVAIEVMETAKAGADRCTSPIKFFLSKEEVAMRSRLEDSMEEEATVKVVIREIGIRDGKWLHIRGSVELLDAVNVTLSDEAGALG